MDKHSIAKELLEKRNKARAEKNFAESDKLRAEIEQLGFQVIDSATTSELIDTTQSTSKPASLILFGSGEISSTGRSVHEKIFQQIRKDKITVGIVTTPAGFQPNVVAVHEEIAEFFRTSLSNFHPVVKILYANTKEDANNEEIAKQLDDVDYIFIGPGSPTYVVKHLANSLLYEKIKEKFSSGTSLCLASAATIAFSHMALPVYEIYKVGSELHWIKGLNFYSLTNKNNLTIIPHFNNTEGGKDHDTSHCFMGEKRFQQLHQLLQKDEIIWGIDEHTAVVIADNKHEVFGKGELHIL